MLAMQNELAGHADELPPWQKYPGRHALHIWLLAPAFTTYMLSAHTHPLMEAVPAEDVEFTGHAPHWVLEM